MKNKTIKVLSLFAFAVLTSCSQHNNTAINNDENASNTAVEVKKTEPHRYGGWYCPDNLFGFPAVDIANWKNVPVVNGRMPTKEETQNGTSLIFVDTEKYPNAKPLDIPMPKLAYFYNESAQREDLIIVIQAVNVDNDSIAGFRYLNGGNGSARLNEVKLLSKSETDKLSASKFVILDFQIEANQAEIWEVLTNPENAKALQPIFDTDKVLKSNWRESINVNYHNPNSGEITAAYGSKLYGNFYIQNDYKELSYTEKFMLIEDELTGKTNFKIVCGPFFDDFEMQQNVLKKWGKKVKEMSEN